MKKYPAQSRTPSWTTRVVQALGSLHRPESNRGNRNARLVRQAQGQAHGYGGAVTFHTRWKRGTDPVVTASFVLVAALHALAIEMGRELPIVSVISGRPAMEAQEVTYFQLPEPVTPIPSENRSTETGSANRLAAPEPGLPTAVPGEFVVEIPADALIPVALDAGFADIPVSPPALPPLPEGGTTEWATYSRFAPSMILPEITNRNEMKRFLDRRYAPLVRSSGAQGTVMVRFWIDETGSVQRAEINVSSGWRQLDELALELAEILRFAPAYQAGAPLRVLVELPIRFEAI